MHVPEIFLMSWILWGKGKIKENESGQPNYSSPKQVIFALDMMKGHRMKFYSNADQNIKTSQFIMVLNSYDPDCSWQREIRSILFLISWRTIWEERNDKNSESADMGHSVRRSRFRYVLFLSNLKEKLYTKKAYMSHMVKLQMSLSKVLKDHSQQSCVSSWYAGLRHSLEPVSESDHSFTQQLVGYRAFRGCQGLHDASNHKENTKFFSVSGLNFELSALL